MFMNSSISYLDLSGFDTSEGTNMSDMFCYADIYNLEISHFSFAKCISSESMLAFRSINRLVSFDCSVLKMCSLGLRDHVALIRYLWSSRWLFPSRAQTQKYITLLLNKHIWIIKFLESYREIDNLIILNSI